MSFLFCFEKFDSGPAYIPEVFPVGGVALNPPLGSGLCAIEIAGLTPEISDIVELPVQFHMIPASPMVMLFTAAIIAKNQIVLSRTAWNKNYYQIVLNDTAWYIM